MPKGQRGEDTGPFSAGEKVMVPHTDKFYEAKVLRCEFRSKEQQWFYLIHYTGWNKNWDEWVEETGLMKSTDQTTRSRRSAQGQKKRKLDEISGAVAEGPKSLNLDLRIPASLQQQLLDDYEAVVQHGHLVPLPRQPCVHDVLALFQKQASRKDDLESVVEGLRSYFDKALPLCLLYEQELQHCAQHLASGVCPAFIWGAEHLLRLFVKLPDLLSQTSITMQQLQRMEAPLRDLMHFLEDNHANFFLQKDAYSEG